MVKIEINTIDKTNVIDWTSVIIQRALTNQVDTCKFRIKRADSAGFKASLLDDVKIYDTDGTTILFGGQIIEMNEVVDGLLEYVEFSCKDYSFDMDRKLVVQVYEDMTVDDIIADIKTNFLSASYDLTNVNCPITLKYIAFNYEYPSKCLQQLAELVNYDWYVDEEKKIYFFLKNSLSAPFSITDTSGKSTYSSLKINKDVKNIRNSIIVRGGKYLGNSNTESFEADGDQITFLQAYQYNSISVTVNGVSKTIGIDNIDDPTSFDCLYNFDEKAIKFPTPPTAGYVVSVTGLPYIPVVTKITNALSIAEYGEFQYKIIDASINSKELARDRARAELRKWALEINEGSFDTNESGLNVGQKISISSVIRGINQSYVISRISTKMDTPTTFKHSVTLVTSQTYGMIEFFQKLLIDKDKQIVIAKDEVLDSIIGMGDIFSISDEDGLTFSKTSPPYLYDDAGSKWGFATWS